MIERIHERLGTTGFVIAIVALVAALGGTALAASGALSGKQKKEVEKIAKKFQGTGPAGAAGANGTNGKDGSNGANGSNGTSATTESFPGNAHGCTEGGVVVKSASPEVVICNGKKGTNGTNGQTGFTKTLPSGETETGTWALGVGASNFLLVPISFNIPLEAPLDSAHVHYVGPGETVAACPGNPEEPKATAGNLCVYQGAVSLITLIEGTETAVVRFIRPGSTLFEVAFEEEEQGSAVSGSELLLRNSDEEAEPSFGWGSWAVTAQ